MITADQLAAHAVGDYLLQSDWMALNKTKRSLPALAHVLCYALPFLLLYPSPSALAVIAASHFVIDRWRLARYVVWAKNFIAPEWIPTGRRWQSDCDAGEYHLRNRPWADCTATGYDPSRPDWLTVWLLIIADNILHVLCNGAALRWL